MFPVTYLLLRFHEQNPAKYREVIPVADLPEKIKQDDGEDQ